MTIVDERREAERGRRAVYFRASRSRVMTRIDAGEDVLSCPECGTETDVPVVAHDNRCTRAPAPIVEAAAVVKGPKWEKGRNGHRRSTSEFDANGQITRGELARRLEATLDAQATVTRCAWCPWTFAGDAAAGREQAALHRAEEHADRKPAKRQRTLPQSIPAVGDPQEPADSPEQEELVPTPTEILNDGQTAADELRARGQDGLAEQALEAAAGLAEKARGAKLSPAPKWTREAAITAIRAFGDELGRRPGQADFVKHTGRGLPSQGVLRNLFGTFGNALVEAGYERVAKGLHPKLSGRAAAAPAPAPVETPAVSPALGADAARPHEPALPGAPEPLSPGGRDEETARPDEPTHEGQSEIASSFATSNGGEQGAALSEPGVAEPLAGTSRRDTDEGQGELASRSLHVPGSLNAVPLLIALARIEGIASQRAYIDFMAEVLTIARDALKQATT